MRLRFLGATYLSFMRFCACFYSVMSCDFCVFFCVCSVSLFFSCLFLSFYAIIIVILPSPYFSPTLPLSIYLCSFPFSFSLLVSPTLNNGYQYSKLSTQGRNSLKFGYFMNINGVCLCTFICIVLYNLIIMSNDHNNMKIASIMTMQKHR